MSIDEGWLRQQFPDLSSLQSLGEHGGQKWVYAAQHDEHSNVVLKIFKPNQEAERVRREILAVEQMRSPRVPRIFNTGLLQTVLGELVWLLEEKIDGYSLRQAVTTQGPLGKKALFTAALQLLEVLRESEKIQIVHRDVKPDNIIVDTQGDYWLLDFGIARHLSLLSQTPSYRPFGLGTPGYSPPEQFRNLKREIDSRADLFGLGMTLYECATGSNPFRLGAHDVNEILQRVERDQLLPLTLDFDTTGEFGQFVSALTQRFRDHRPQSVNDALEWMKDIANSSDYLTD